MTSRALVTKEWPFHGYGRCPPRARETPAGSAGEPRAENAIVPGEVGGRGLREAG
jgi:hypothetical protein